MSQILETLIQNYSAEFALPVQWGDMDSFNHVNNVIYFRYFESARLALFEKTSMMTRMKEVNIGPILAETQCQYRLAVTYPDHLRVFTKVKDITEFGFTQEYAIYSHALDAITTRATSRVTMVDYNTGEKAVLDGNLLEELKQLQRS